MQSDDEPTVVSGGAAALTIAAGADVAGAVESRGTFSCPLRGGVRHPQRLRDDDGPDARRHRPLRRARQERRHRRRRRRPQGGRRGSDRRARHDRAAGLRRYPLAHVEHAAPEHGRRQARARLFPDRRDPGQAVHARRHVPGNPPGRRRGAVQRIHVRPRLVPQHPRAPSSPPPTCERSGVRAARPILVRRRRRLIPRPRRSISPTSSGCAATGSSLSSEGLLDLGLAWRGMGAAPRGDPARGLPQGVRHGARRSASRSRSTSPTTSLQSRTRSTPSAKANLLGKDVQLIHAIWITPEEIRAIAAAGCACERLALHGAANRLRLSADRRAPRRAASRSACRWTRPRCRATPTCSPS